MMKTMPYSPIHLSRTSLRAMAALCLAGASLGALASEAADLMKQRRQLSSGWQNSMANVKMKIVEANGETSLRELKQYAQEVSDDGNRTINIFLKPKDVDGLAVLTHSHTHGNDDQWLYLPSSQRVKRIASTNRSGAFVGSEFAYEDISSFEVDKYSYGAVSRTTLDGKPVIAVASQPTYENSGYSKLMTYLDTKTYQPHKIEYFNARGEVFKTLVLSQYKPYSGQAGWRPHVLDMVNHLTGRRTVIEYSAYEPSRMGGDAFNANKLGQIR